MTNIKQDIRNLCPTAIPSAPNHIIKYNMPILGRLRGFKLSNRGNRQSLGSPHRKSKLPPERSSGMSIIIIIPNNIRPIPREAASVGECMNSTKFSKELRHFILCPVYFLKYFVITYLKEESLLISLFFKISVFILTEQYPCPTSFTEFPNYYYLILYSCSPTKD